MIRQLIEYKKFKDAAGRLQVLETAAENTFARLPGKPVFDHLETETRQTTSIFELLNAVNSILKRFNEREDLRDIFEDKWTVSEKIEYIVRTLTTRENIRFSELFEDAMSRSEVVCTFLALLELIRLKQLVCAQSEAFAEIEIRRAATVIPIAAATAPVTEAAASPEATIADEVKS